MHVGCCPNDAAVVVQLATLTEHGKQLISDQHFEAKNIQHTLTAVTERYAACSNNNNNNNN